MYRLLSSLLAIALLLVPSFTAPVNLQGRSFKVHQKRNNLSAPRCGHIEMDRAYRKYGFPSLEINQLDITDGTSDSHADFAADTTNPDVTGTGAPASKVAATSQEGDAEFLSPISIGGQTMSMNFDTGSSDL